MVRVTGLPTWLVPLSKIVTVMLDGPSSGLKKPTLVRKVPTPVPGLFRIEVRTVVACASDSSRPGMNMPTEFCGAVENRRLVTTSWSSEPENSNSTPPPVSCASNASAAATMSSNAFASRGASVNWICLAGFGHVPMKQRYVAVTSRLDV